MTGRGALELDTLTIRIPIRLQRRGARKLIMTPEGVAAPKGLRLAEMLGNGPLAWEEQRRIVGGRQSA